MINNKKMSKGITLIALVVTIIVLLILAGISVQMLTGDNGILQRSIEAKTMTDDNRIKEELDMMLMEYKLSNEYENNNGDNFQTLLQYLNNNNKVNIVKEKQDNLVVEYQGKKYIINKISLQSKEYQSESLKIDDEIKVLNALKNGTSLLTVNYEPASTDKIYIIPDKYSGKDVTQEDLTIGKDFTQASILGTGSNKLKWYVLYTDDEGVNLVSEPTKSGPYISGSAGYDNCLYFFDKLSKEFFSNENQYGVTQDRIHALRLSDIKKAAEQQNIDYKIGERYWSWNDDFVLNAPYKSTGANFNSIKNYTNGSRYYPGIYTPNLDGSVTCNNQLYDEEVKELITDDSGIEERGLATKLTIKATFFSYSKSKTLQMKNLGTFGNSKIAKQLFNSAESYYLGTNYINSFKNNYYNEARFGLHKISSGYLNSESGGFFCASGGGGGMTNNAVFRVVVSIPASHIDVADDGTLSLK